MTSVTLVRRIKAPPKIVFEAVTTAEGIAHWWGPDAGPVLLAECDPRVGGRYRIRFRRMLTGMEHECSGEFLVVDPPRRVVMSWRWAGLEDPGESQVEFSLRAIGVGTELTFTHSGLHDEASRDSHAEGWSGALEKLQTYLAPGR